MAPVLNTLSPPSGPPGTTVTVTGSGFYPAAQIGCPALVPTTMVDDGTLTAEIPADMAGAQGTSVMVAVYVRNPDGQVSASGIFTVVFPVRSLQSWTTVEAVCGEVPGFARGGQIKDAQIVTWMKSVAQEIASAMLRRGLSTDPSTWAQPGAGGDPTAAELLGMINRLGAASRLAAALAGQFSTGEWGLARSLESNYRRMVKALQDGDYDKLFRPAAATVESAALLSAGDLENEDGTSSSAFTKGRVF